MRRRSTKGSKKLVNKVVVARQPSATEMLAIFMA